MFRFFTIRNIFYKFQHLRNLYSVMFCVTPPIVACLALKLKDKLLRVCQRVVT